MFRLDNVLERWAEVYVPLSHRSKEHNGAPTFFRISQIDAESYFIKNFNRMPSLCMCYVTHVNVEMNKQSTKFTSQRHVIFFLKKQEALPNSATSIDRDEGASEARYEAADMPEDLLAFFDAVRLRIGGKALPKDVIEGVPQEVLDFIEQTAKDPVTRLGIEGLQTQEAYWETLPTRLNGWQVCAMTIEGLMPRRKCLLPNRYAMPQD